MWHRFINATDMFELSSDERFTSNLRRVENHEALKALIDRWVSNRRVNDIVKLLTDHGIPSCPIYTVKDVVEDPHIARAREMVIDLEQPRMGRVKLLGCPVKMSETLPSPKGAAPALGENTGAILNELLGFSMEEIEGLRTKGVL
jgi:formyl-CoA transferase